MRRFKHIEEQKSRKDTYQSPLLADRKKKNPIIVNIKHPRLQKTKLQKKKKTTTTTPP